MPERVWRCLCILALACSAGSWASWCSQRPVFSLIPSVAAFLWLKNENVIQSNFVGRRIWWAQYEKTFLQKDSQAVEQATQRGSGGATPGDFQVPTGHSPEKPGLKLVPNLLWAGNCTGGLPMSLPICLITGSYDAVKSASCKSQEWDQRAIISRERSI